MISRRSFLGSTPALLSATAALSACSAEGGQEPYRSLVARTWRLGEREVPGGAALVRELVRCATLAPSSHNTQCWRFVIEEGGVTILPDLSRRCPSVDPDDHHLFVSIGCAVENLCQAARFHGQHAEARFDAARDAVQIRLSPTRAVDSPLFRAIPERQNTRGLYDGQALAATELAQLARAATAGPVRLLLLTERRDVEEILQYVVQGNSAQMDDPAFVAELKAWMRFNAADAARLGDGLYSVSSGNPAVPAWLGRALFGLFFTKKAENEKYVRHLRSSAGVAVFIGEAADKAHWVEVGRAYERFALQATALGIRSAMVNQPVEVAALRPQLASHLGVGPMRPDLVVRFGRGPKLPPSLRRPVSSVLA